jgi:putative ABC transport system substrate-binding protein
MRRREFVAGLAGAAAWPVAAHAQQPLRKARIGVLASLAEDDPEGRARIGAFLQGMQQLGWTGSNLQIETRWGGDAERIRRHAAELGDIAPDAILASGGAVVGPLLQVTRTIPIVFTITPDPVGAGFADSLARPGGNATGFTSFEYGMGAQWLDLLKQINPTMTRTAVLRDAAIIQGPAQFAAIQTVAPSLGIELTPINVFAVADIERGIATFARLANAGLIVTASALATHHRDLIVTLAARHRLPTVYSNRVYVTSGGLISYAADSTDPHRRAAAYVDRILKGEKPADMPVQTPTKYELIINLKTAKALGLSVPESILARADEVIE